MYAALSPLQTRSLSEEKIRSLSRMSCASTRCPCRLSWACFFFSAYPQFLLIPLSLNGDHTAFSHLGSPLPFNSSTTGSHSFNGAGNPFCWCHSLPWPQNRKQGHTRAFLFSAQSLSRPFPYGERRGCSRIWAVPVLLDSPTTAPHGPNGAGLGPCWCRSAQHSKPYTGSHRAKFGFHCFFLGCFGSGSAAKSRSNL